MTARIALTAAAVALVAGPAAAEDIIYATNVPSTHITADGALVPFGKTLEETTGGDVTFRPQWGGMVAQNGAVLTAIRDGLADMGMTADLYAGQDLINSITISNMPMLGNDALVMTGVASESRLLDCPSCEEELAEFDAFLYAAFGLPAQYLVCREPVKSLADLQGKTVRATGPLARVLAGWGATPVAMPVSDGYEALERGQVQCSTGTEPFIMEYNWWDSAKYVLDLPLGGFAGVLTPLSITKFESLDPEDQKAMLALRAKLAADSAYAYHAAAAKARKLGIEEHGMTYLEPEADIVAAAEKAREQEVEAALEEAEKRGATDPKARIDRAVELAKKWEKIVEETGHDPVAFAEALDREVYSRLAR